MKIAVIQPRASYYLGGGEIAPIEQSRQFLRLGQDLTFFTSNRGPLTTNFISLKKEFPAAIVEVDCTNMSDIYEKPAGQDWFRWDIESIRFATNISRDKRFSQNFDAYIYHNLLDSISSPDHTKTLIHLHGYPEKLNYAHTLALNGKKHFLSASRLITKKWEAMTDLQNVVTIPNGIDASYFYPNNSNKTIDFLSVGRLVEIKGIQYFIDAIDHLKRAGIRPRIVIAGEGPLREELIRQSKGLENIIWKGRVTNTELIQLYRNSKYLVLPSYSREGIMTTMLEAAACGTASIVTKNSSMCEFVTKRNGMTFKPQNSTDLAATLKKALAVDYKLLGQTARNDIENSWTWEKRAKEHMEALTQWF